MKSRNTYCYYGPASVSIRFCLLTYQVSVNCERFLYYAFNYLANTFDHETKYEAKLEAGRHCVCCIA